MSAPPARIRDQNVAIADTVPVRKAPEKPAESANNQTPNNQTEEISRLQRNLRAVTTERDAAMQELVELRNAQPPQTRRAFQPPPSPARSALVPNAVPAMIEPPPPLPVASTASTVKLALPTLAAPPVRSEGTQSGRHLNGFWYYAKPANPPDKTAGYAPEFIEATITEEKGVLHGSYRSRFRIVDRAISPDVNFSFAGLTNGSTIRCPWSGPGGAKGELTLRLVSENSMRVDWLAVDLGTQQGLASGTAVLTRKVD